jgi:hypothetical protein
MRDIQRNVMKDIKINKAKLLDIVQANKVKHVEEFKESVEDYKKLVLKIATTNLDIAQTGDRNEFNKIKSMPTAPASYEDSYRRAICMLELSEDELIEIEEHTFNQLVLDEWQWKNSFVTTSTMYKAGI